MSDIQIPASPSTSQRWALAALLLGAVAIGSSPIFVRLSEVGPVSTAFWRVSLAFIPLFLIYAGGSSSAASGSEPRTWSDRFLLLLPGAFLAVDLLFWHSSLHLTSVANATLLSNMAPIFVTLFGWLLFKAKISRTFLIGLGLAIAGVIILKGGPMALGGGSLAGDSLALAAAFFYGGYIMVVGRLRARFSTIVIMLWSTASAAILILPLALLYEPALLPFTLFGWAIIIGLAWFTHAGGQGMITFALAFLPAAFSSLTLLIQPVVAGVLAWAILDEPMGMMQMIGGIVVLFGIFVARRG